MSKYRRNTIIAIIIAYVLIISSWILFPEIFYSRQIKVSLAKAGNNKKELIAVLEHYRWKDRAKSKYARFLIENMPGHHFINGQDVFKYAIDETIPLVEDDKYWPNFGEFFSHLCDSIHKHNKDKFSIIRDEKHLSSDYLIENIEYAFQAWKHVPEHLRCDEHKFMNYVLPYRNIDEVPEPGLREYFFKKYNWFFDRLRENNSIERSLCELMDSINIRIRGYFKYPFTVPVSYSYKLGVTPLCTNQVNAWIFILRALGIPATADFTPVWGNNRSGKGHEWLVLFCGDQVYALNVENRQMLKNLYSKESLPKVYRKLFCQVARAGGKKDVTDKYCPVSDLTLSCDKGYDKAILSIFNKNEWIPLLSAGLTKGKFVFRNMGRGSIYKVDLVKDNSIQSKLIYLDKAGNQLTLQPDHVHKSTLILNRKYPPFTLRAPHILKWGKCLMGAEIQASNGSNFEKYDVLYKFKNIHTLNPIEISIKNTRPFSFYRIMKPDSSTMFLSTFMPKAPGKGTLNYSKYIMKTEFFQPNGDIIDCGNRLLDGDPMTFIWRPHYAVMISFATPVVINEFVLQTRTDENNVKPGCEYELMYWDNKWESAGMKPARDTLLIFENIPSSTAYWLINHSEGIEEQIFLYKNGRQWWPSVSCYEGMVGKMVDFCGE